MPFVAENRISRHRSNTTTKNGSDDALFGSKADGKLTHLPNLPLVIALRMAQRTELTAILAAGSFLVDSPQSSTAHNLKTALISRLHRYHNQLGNEPGRLEQNSLEDVELETAKEAINIVERVHTILDIPSSNADANASETSLPSTEVLLGIRDLTEIRTLISIAFKWGIDPLLGRVVSAWPSKPPSIVGSSSQIIDLTNTPESHRLLSSFVIRLMRILFPGGIAAPLSQTLVTTTILQRHLVDLLKPSLALGWLPKRLASESIPTIDEVRPLLMRLLSTLPPSQTITALGSVLSGPPLPPPHVHKTCTSLLSRQLLRPEGVRGLCIAVFGQDHESVENASFEKLDHVSRVLSSVPAGMEPEKYFETVVPRILALLVNESPSSHKRAAAYAVSRMLSMDGSFSHGALVAAIVFPILHDPFLYVTSTLSGAAIPVNLSPSYKRPPLAPAVALSALINLSTNMDPSPALISSLLLPIVSALYSLLAHMDRMKTSDPVLKESLRSLLGTWGRVSVSQECVEALWDVIDGGGGEWKILIDGEIERVERPNDLEAFSLLTPEDLRQTDKDFNSSLLNLRPDPDNFVRFLKSIDRPDVSSELFVRTLEAYRFLKSKEGSDPMRVILFLQLIIQMQGQLSNSNSSSNILAMPEHILSFVKHALESAAVPESIIRGKRPTDERRLRMEDLRIVDQYDSLSDQEVDSDDDDTPADAGFPDDEMTETAVNLLLSVLEANEDLSARTTPVLNDIFSLLEPLINHTSHSLRTAAREARLVMTARLASSSAPISSKSSEAAADKEDPQVTYQRALKLLQDPILPVRAHGLLLLRQLVSSQSTSSLHTSRIDPALVPAILSIFVQAIQDDDSYMFLNAVQGLAAMVDIFGKDVLKSLVNIYAQGLDGIAASNITQNDVNTRLRVGEALGQVIRRYGAALVIYVDILIPPLFKIFRSHHIPTVLRTSALSLLGECENTNSLSLLAYINDLFEAMIDLLQVESVAVANPESSNNIRPEDESEGKTKEPNIIDTQSSPTESKSPSLRRAALHFLLMVIRATTVRLYDSGGKSEVSYQMSTKRARTTLAFTASTDDDVVVKVMAREALEALEQLQQATVLA